LFLPQLATPHRWRRLLPRELPVSTKLVSRHPDISMGSTVRMIAGRRSGKSAIGAELEALKQSDLKEAWVCDRCGHEVRWEGVPPDRPVFPDDIIRGIRVSFMRGLMNEALGRSVHGDDPVPECDSVFVRSVMES